MGLAGRKDKQRIGTDPRNLTWTDDAAKFGQNYLTKMGWDPSRGLGATGDGRTSHIKVAQKLNLLGIGAGVAGARGEADGVAWKQNREYEMLLKRLNEGLGEVEGGREDGKEETGKEEEEKEVVSEKTKKKKKRKRDDDVEAHSDEKTKKKTKDEKDRKERKKEKKREQEKVEELVDKKLESKPEAEPSTSTPVIQAPIPRPMAHRARFLRSKQLASRSSTAVAEILGISASNSPNPSSFPVSLAGSSSATPWPPSSESSTPVSARVPETDQEIRTSSTSVGDYFKAKLAARAKSAGPPANASASSSSSSGTRSPTSIVPGVARNSNAELDYDRPPAGIGSRGVLYGEVQGAGDGDTPRGGLGMKFGGLMGHNSSSQGVSSLVPEVARATASAMVTEDASEEPCSCDEKEKKKSKEKKKKDKKKGKKDGESNTIERDGSSASVSAEVSADMDGSNDTEAAAKEKRRIEKAERKAKRRNEKEKKGRREELS